MVIQRAWGTLFAKTETTKPSGTFGSAPAGRATISDELSTAGVE